MKQENIYFRKVSSVLIYFFFQVHFKVHKLFMLLQSTTGVQIFILNTQK